MPDSRFMIPFYDRFDVHLVRGKGVHVYDARGKRYIDFGSGVGTNSLGHCHPALVRALEDQAKKLWHTSNLYRLSGAELLAEKLASFSFADMVFFGNSGAEAVECGLKIVRSYQNGKGRPERYKILTIRESFHGRTYATHSALEPKRLLALLYPYVDWFVSTNPDINSIRDEVGKGNVGAILLEPVQGEGGIHVMDGSLLKELRSLCNEQDLLLFFDCVQCGSGRTGKFFAYEHWGVEPDICTLAKGIGSGFPVGACLVTKTAAEFVVARMHGSTCGGNPLATAVSGAVVDEILKDGFLDNVQKNGKYLMERLVALSRKFPIIEKVRGIGLMTGIEIHSKTCAVDVAEKLVSRGLLVAPASGNVLRMMPPLIVSCEEIDEAVSILESWLEKEGNLL